jgi:hypothetical protein
MQREIDHERWEAQGGQFPRRHEPVIPIEPHPLREREADEDHDGGNRSADKAKVGMALADVVEEGRNHDIVVLDP